MDDGFGGGGGRGCGAGRGRCCGGGRRGERRRHRPHEPPRAPDQRRAHGQVPEPRPRARPRDRCPPSRAAAYTSRGSTPPVNRFQPRVVMDTSTTSTVAPLHLCPPKPSKPLANGVRHPLEAPRRAIAAKLEQVARRRVREDRADRRLLAERLDLELGHRRRVGEEQLAEPAPGDARARMASAQECAAACHAVRWPQEPHNLWLLTRWATRCAGSCLCSWYPSS